MKRTNTPPDLLVIPQTGSQIPGDHLTPQEADDVRTAWANYDAPGPRAWNIAIAHIINGEPRITSRVTLPADTAAVA